jgi:uncharacterized surface protein with fasciclin (FAS1) repeats
MKKVPVIFAVALLGLVAATARYSRQERTVMVGGQVMFPSKASIDNAVNSADHTTLVAAVKAAGLLDTLTGQGPFTVFAPPKEAFARLPPGAVENPLKPENPDMLAKVLTYHVVPDASALRPCASKFARATGTPFSRPRAAGS